MAVATDTAIRPFHIEVSQEQLDDLRRRILATRWPSRELVPDRSQGVQLETLQELARYWTTDYDWRKAEAKLDALPQFTTQIDGVDIHFIHVKSPHADALPLVMTHGWPGLVSSSCSRPLARSPIRPCTAAVSTTRSTSCCRPCPATASRQSRRRSAGIPACIARPWAELMNRLGYSHYVAQGGDVGALVTDTMGRQAPGGAGRHPLELALGRPRPSPDQLPADSEKGARGPGGARHLQGDRGFLAYFLEQATRPQTIGYALLGFTRRAGRMDARPRHGQLLQGLARPRGRQAHGYLTRDHVGDNITLYWLTGTGASAARAYWESGRAQARAVRRGSSRNLHPSRVYNVPR